MWPFKSKQKFASASASSYTEELVQPLKAEAVDEKREADRGYVASNYQVVQAPQEKVIACLVTHGMGQQVPFETLGELAESLVAGMPDVRPVVNRVLLTKGEDPLSRMEIYLAGKDGRPNIRLHLYEGYWAPLTEGKVTFLEASKFLITGALNGIRTSCTQKKFARWVFGEMREFPIKPGTSADLMVTFLFLLLGIGLAFLLEAKLHASYAAAKAWWHLHPLSYVLTVLHRLWSSLWGWLALLFQHPVVAAGSLLHHLLSGFADLLHSAGGVAILVFAGIYVYFFNYFMVEFVGDVAIYISSHKVSKFEEVRTAIQKTIFKVASQLYSATSGPNGRKLYDRIILVGHSLGSVISYDLLNELIAWDRACQNGDMRVVSRTSRLITFGSPLDKTAYLFRSQVSADHHYREALAALQQPLVLDYALRPYESFKWVNIFAWADVVSGHLIYYDLPAGTHLPKNMARENVVQNMSAAEAWVPIYAHVQYWGGKTLRAAMWEAITES